MGKDTLTIDDIAQGIISEAVTIHSNDIHILPESEEYIVYLRTSQQLKAARHLKNEEGRRLIAYFKYLGDMDVGEHRRPQSGSCKMILESLERDLRFSTMTNFHAQESLVIRILNPMETIDLTLRESLLDDDLVGKTGEISKWSDSVFRPGRLWKDDNHVSAHPQ